MMDNFLFPNDQHIIWSLMIVMYPYITGLVAGAFIVSSLYHVFHVEALEPVAKFSLVSSMAFLCFAPLPLLFHLGHPERALNVMVTPNFRSAMAGFGFIYGFYFLIVWTEIWLVFRPDIIRMAREKRGLVSQFYKAIALWELNDTPGAFAIDKKITRGLSILGIPAAIVLHGYVGFLFGALKANAWWSTPLMPIIFILSAIVSGIAILVVTYQIRSLYAGIPADGDCLKTLCKYLWGFFIIDISLELLEILVLYYEAAEEWEVVSHLLKNQLFESYLVGQLLFGALVPLCILIAVFLSKSDSRVLPWLTFISSSIVLTQVFAMRWNVVIGGQMFSKSLRGFRSYVPPFWDWEGIFPAIILMALVFVFLIVLTRMFPVWESSSPNKEASKA